MRLAVQPRSKSGSELCYALEGGGISSGIISIAVWY